MRTTEEEGDLPNFDTVNNFFSPITLKKKIRTAEEEGDLPSFDT